MLKLPPSDVNNSGFLSAENRLENGVRPPCRVVAVFFRGQLSSSSTACTCTQYNYTQNHPGESPKREHDCAGDGDDNAGSGSMREVWRHILGGSSGPLLQPALHHMDPLLTRTVILQIHCGNPRCFQFPFPSGSEGRASMAISTVRCVAAVSFQRNNLGFNNGGAPAQNNSMFGKSCRRAGAGFGF